MSRYLITTPIYYPNSVPHIGTALTTVLADMICRYQRMQDAHPFLLTGTDENGLKLKEAAEAVGKEPKVFVKEISDRFREVWKELNIETDDFIRTTEPRHIKAVQHFFKVLKEREFVYLSTYEGWYDVSSETFFKESDLVDGKSPDGNPVRWVEEQNYFFKLSAFAQPLLDYIESHPDFLQPVSRKNEAVSFIKAGLRDVCISRHNPGWGIEVPGDPARVIYVWFDALISYLSVSGWPHAGWEDKWPATLHLMAKDIFTRFHATLWPAMLMAAELPLPKAVVGHGWLLMGGEKISKSKGNVIAPMAAAQELSTNSGASLDVCIDALRFILASVTPYEGDAGFSLEEFERRYNADLANDLGNALNRTLSIVHRFANGTVPGDPIESEALDAVAKAKSSFANAMENFRVDHACSAAIDLIRFLNKYVDSRAPWALAKANDPQLGSVLRSMLYVLSSAEGIFRPLMPKTADEMARQLNSAPTHLWSAVGESDQLPAGTKVLEPTPIFPRLELTPQVQLAKKPNETKKMNSPTAQAEPKSTTPEEITIEDFAKVQLKVARIFEAEPLEGSDKLMKLQVVLGEEKRQIVAGIRKSYSPEDLIGRQIIVVANLKPAKLRGTESQGMLLAATDEDGAAILLQPDREAPEGSRVK